jgi:hypothetical protein
MSGIREDGDLPPTAAPPTAAPPIAAPTTATPCHAVQRAQAWIAEMALIDADVDQDGDRIALLTVMEAVKATSAAVQARVTADFVKSQTAAAQELADAELASVGLVPHELQPNLVRRSVCAQVALARREAPDRGPVLVNLAEALTTDLPATMSALTSGATSEYRAVLVHRETASLSPELRREADAALAAALRHMAIARSLNARESRRCVWTPRRRSVGSGRPWVGAA